MGQRLRNFTLQPAALVANGYALSQKPAGGGVQALTLSGSLVTAGVGTPDVARRVAITSSGNDSAINFVITGTNRYGVLISETLGGPNTATVYSLRNYATVTSITASGNTTGNITAGTNGVVSTSWFPLDRLSAGNLGISVQVSGVVNYTIEQTMDDPFTSNEEPSPPSGAQPPYLQPYPHPVLAAQTINGMSAITNGMTAVRLTLNSFTNPGSAKVSYAPGFIEDDAA